MLRRTQSFVGLDQFLEQTQKKTIDDLTNEDWKRIAKKMQKLSAEYVLYAGEDKKTYSNLETLIFNDE